ncbi:MAG TPA: hypothetical protein GX510_01935 [Firmicutes bacterium]|nr:hypothetical protein [Candidatus Fermentithermobacillaceae bacterium]
MAVLVVLLTLLTMAGCFLGCVRQFKPVPIEEGQIPEGVKKRVEEELQRTFSSVTDVTWCVLDEYEGGLFVVAMFRGNPRLPTTDFQSDTTYYVWGHLRQVTEDAGSEWSGPVRRGPLQASASPSAPRGYDFAGRVFPAAELGVYAVGWVTYSQATKIQLIRSDGSAFDCTVKNGFWWTGPHKWGSYFPDRAVVYDKSGKALYEGDFPPAWRQPPR